MTSWRSWKCGLRRLLGLSQWLVPHEDNGAAAGLGAGEETQP